MAEKIREAAEEGHSILVFSQWVRVLELLKKRLGSMDISYLDGSMTAAKRNRVISGFNESDEKRVFLLSLRAGGVGINLVKADYVFLIDPWWNPSVENQAIDRSHRIGQERKVLACRFIVENSIEEKVLELQNRKRELVENLFETGDSLFSHITPEEIMSLFQA